MTTLAILIATKDRPAELEVCVRRVLEQDPHPEEIVVVDQSARPTADRIAAMCRTAAVPLRYDHAPHLAGLTAARNRAVALASADIVLFLDDDVELLPGYLAALRGVFEADGREEVGGASGYSVNLVSTLSAAKRIRSMLFYRGPFSVERDSLAFHLRPGSEPRRAQRLHGSNMAFRRAVFTDMRFDETYTGYGFGEDRDFSVLLARRRTLLWVPEARLIHHEAPRSRLSRERFCELRILSWGRFYDRCVPKTPYAAACYLWLNVGFIVLLLKLWDWPTVRGTYRGLRRLLRILRGREDLEAVLSQGWSATSVRDV